MADTKKSKIQYINMEKRFGYISKLTEEESKDYFFLEKDLINIDFDKLSKGLTVIFQIETRKNVKYARNIKLDSENIPVSITNDENIEDNINPYKTDNYLYPGATINDSELIIGIVSPVGAESDIIIDSLITKLQKFSYYADTIKLSSLLPKFETKNDTGEYDRIKHYIKQGDLLRERSQNNAILATGAIKLIAEKREENKQNKKVYIIDSLKHPDEVELLRKVYGEGFYLFGIHADKDRRLDFLSEKGCEPEQANELINTDENENISHGQKTRDTYHLSDFFLNIGNNTDQVRNTLQRFLDLIFSNPYLNPTFDEFAMFMAFNSSVRSGDLSRQVGAVISKKEQIVATGANDVPKFGGGLYWAVQNSDGKIEDIESGKDYKKGFDSNKNAQNEMIQRILRQSDNLFSEEEKQKKKLMLEEILKKSQIADLTEFGRVVHAEMEAILSCGREGISTLNSVLYCTTFPCHNCAKHIIASGIQRVVYVEPYPKSKALDFHSESIELKSSFDINTPITNNKVIFEPFIGVGPRRFLDLFSMSLGAGIKLKRKQKTGAILSWDNDSKSIRTPLLTESYRDLEKKALSIWEEGSN
ncbi:anti-phage dCTP deaminase [Otariodibacter sp.]|uniref:anti-phage dCTP deaminase n=1 Tax=Otariodibacter sp. TaxID=3030919 RepID=UPI00260783EA|nr:anti-phage dCTP deaminase [Otariodibacter sp.]